MLHVRRVLKRSKENLDRSCLSSVKMSLQRDSVIERGIVGIVSIWSASYSLEKNLDF